MIWILGVLVLICALEIWAGYAISKLELPLEPDDYEPAVFTSRRIK